MTIELKVHVARDEETGVWYIAASDIPGLRVEADTADELIRKVDDIGPELIELNIEEIVAAQKPSRAAKTRTKPDSPGRPPDRPRTVIRPVFDSPLAVAC
ncbi:MAG: DUF1902 domain-containing protein [Sphingomicrobium sp.]|nr:DUF1902 domain-containing protein [Sphingomonadales bacterium]